MRTRLVAAACVFLLVGASCGSSDAEPQEATGSSAPSSSAPQSPAPSFATSAAIIETDDGPVLIDVEVAQTSEQRQHGLMNRTHLDEDAGMIFIFFEPSTTGFWMKNTLIPLSIAYFGKDGKILRIMDMEPCKRDPCPVYDPGVVYRGALEVNQGAFDRWGVAEGDIIRMNQ